MWGSGTGLIYIYIYLHNSMCICYVYVLNQSYFDTIRFFRLDNNQQQLIACAQCMHVYKYQHNTISY